MTEKRDWIRTGNEPRFVDRLFPTWTDVFRAGIAMGVANVVFVVLVFTLVFIAAPILRVATTTPTVQPAAQVERYPEVSAGKGDRLDGPRLNRFFACALIEDEAAFQACIGRK